MAYENQVFCPHSSRALHQFNQHAGHIFGVDENNRRAMRANARLVRAQHARALCHHLVARGDNVIDLETNMVLAASRVLSQKASDGTCVIYWLDQLNLAVWQFNKTNLALQDEETDAHMML